MSNPLSYWFASAEKEDRYEIEHSLRFRGSQTLTRTPGSDGSARSFTASVWLKKSIQGEQNFTILKSMASNDSEWAYFNFGESSGDADQITCRSKTSGGYVFGGTSRKYRDPAAWMHLVLTIDKAANTATGYVNGVQFGNIATASGWTFNKPVSGDPLNIGNNLQGYLSEFHFVDGAALDPTTFGEYDTSGVWVPKSPAEELESLYLDAYPAGVGTLSDGWSGTNVTNPGSAWDNDETTATSSANTAGTITWNGNIPTSGTTQILCSSGGGSLGLSNGFTLNGVDITGKVAAAGGVGVTPVWVDVTTEAGSAITSYSQTTASGTNNPALYAMRTGGRRIQEQQTGIAKYPEDGTPTPYRSGWNSVTRNAKLMFDGNPGTACGVNSNGQTAIWNGSIPCPAGSTVIIRCGVGGGNNSQGWLYVNGTNIGNRVPVDANLHDIDISDVVAGTNITEIRNAKIQFVANGSIAGISINGAFVTDASTYYGDNGFHLDFSDPDNIGTDRSGTGNNFTPSGFELGNPYNVAYDWCADSPTNNFSLWNPLWTFSGSQAIVRTYTDANRSYFTGRNSPANSIATIPVPKTGKYFWEGQIGASGSGGSYYAGMVMLVSGATPDGGYTNGVAASYEGGGGVINFNDSATSSSGEQWRGSYYQIGMLLDMDNRQVTFYKDGVEQGSGVFNGNYFDEDLQIYVQPATGSSTQVTCWWNAGQWEYNYPLGTSSATDAFNTILYNGNNGVNVISGVGFSPDLLWIKRRDSSTDHYLFDQLRGAGPSLHSNTADAEANDGNLNSFESDGFVLLGNNPASNDGSGEYVAWCWNAGAGGPTSNTDGTIQSTVKASPENGFSVITYTGNGVGGATVGHGLGKTPSMLIVKSRNSNSWYIRHEGLDPDRNLNFNSSGVVDQGGSGIIADLGSGGTGSQQYFTLQQGSNNVNNVNQDQVGYVAYCFADTPGRVKTGTYTGNGTSSGPYVELGFKPAMVLIKASNAAETWIMMDSARPKYSYLYPNQSAAEGQNLVLDFLQSGFQPNVANTSVNTNTVVYTYIAFAENFIPEEGIGTLSTANLEDVTIKDPKDHFNTVLWTGDNNNPRDIDLGADWDLIWVKNRTNGYSHNLVDRVRGTQSLYPDLTGAEGSEGQPNGYVDSYISNGIRVASSGASGGAYFNEAGNNYVAWCWKAGGTASSNTDGTVTSQVSVNQAAGFSIATYTGTGSNASIGHGLNATPSLSIVKATSNAQSWWVWHQSFGNNVESNNQFIELNGNGAVYTNDDVFRGFTDTLMHIGTDTGSNQSGVDYVTYNWVEIPGYSSFGTYRGNGSEDGTFVMCGFRPALVIVKRTDGTDTWTLWDNRRPEYNEAYYSLIPSENNAEQANEACDLLSNGFKLRRTPSYYNGSGSQYIYMAWAEHPFGGSNVAPAPAR